MDNTLIVALISLTLSIYALILSLRNTKGLLHVCKVLVFSIGAKSIDEFLDELDSSN